MIKNIFVGKADWGYFIDTQCNREHNGNPCSCGNISIVETREEALKIGFEASSKYNVPMITDWDEDSSKFSCDIYTIDDYEDLLSMENIIGNNPIDKVYIRDVFENSLYDFLEGSLGFIEMDTSEEGFQSVYKKYKIKN